MFPRQRLMASCCLVLVWSSVVSAFALTAPFARLTIHLTSNIDSNVNHLLAAASDSFEEYLDSDVREMENLIVSISLEQTDDSRRKRLALLFAEELAKPNGGPQYFTDLFGQVLIDVGDRVQVEARKEALEKAHDENSDLHDAPNVANESDNAVDNSLICMGKSPVERQLWALVDMMVQSKTIVKKATGQLGNKGSFQ